MFVFIYQFFNYFFFFFHTILILFNTLGWIIKKVRRLNLITLALTALSWFGLGIWYGWGYCVCTDWHWKIRQHLGYNDHTNSYIQLLLLKLTGITFPSPVVDVATATVFFLSLLISIVLNIKDYRSKLIKRKI